MKRFVAVSMAAWACAAAAQTPSTGQTFRAGVEVTTIDVTVVDRDGFPVADLTPQDISVSVDGRSRTIVSAQFVAVASPTSAAASVASPLPRTFTTNARTAPGRLIALVVDQGNIRPGGERAVLKAAEGYLDRLTPADRIALFAIPAPGPFVAFTGDAARVKSALRRITGRYNLPIVRHNIAAVEALAIEDGDGEVLSRVIARECARGDSGCPEEIELEARAIAPQVTMRTNETLGALSGVFTFLKAIDGPKTMVLMSEGLILGHQRFPEGLPREVEHLATQARAAVYVLRLDQASFDASEQRPVGRIDQTAQTVGLETIAGVTGGDLMTVVGTGAPIFERVARETAGFYLVGIETTAQDRDGKPHRIKVGVKRGRVQVRARREFQVEPETTRAEDASPSAAILAALRAPLPVSGLALRVTSYAADINRGQVRVVVAAEVGEGFTQAARIGLGYALTDAGGTIVRGHAGPVTLQPGPDGRLRYLEEFSISPGDYTFKLAAADAAGHLGSLDRAVHAELTHVGPIELADLVLHDQRDAERGTPLGVEVVAASGSLACAVDMKTQPGALPPGVSVSFELADAKGGVRQRVAARLVSSEDGARHIARATVDTSALPPGEYVARGVVVVGGQAKGEVTRAFRVALRP